MKQDEEVLRKLIVLGKYVQTKKVNEILFEVWGNDYDANMHCNHLMKSGFIDYHDGDWKILITQDKLDELIKNKI